MLAGGRILIISFIAMYMVVLIHSNMGGGRQVDYPILHTMGGAVVLFC